MPKADPTTVENVAAKFERHTDGERCRKGACGGTTYPKECSNKGCDGLIHAEYASDGPDGGGRWAYTCCDHCGEQESAV